ncbi:MAG: DNA repair protein RecN [Nitrospirae bacterium]|nr:MAG: DNA repair protein RecN [Nitrospirota bacterium]
MLRELYIKSFTIIDEAALSFEEGFNVLTGETGAGKSIVVDAIGLLLGDKASQDVIKSGAKEAVIEASFDGPEIPELEELSIGSEDGVVLRRNISSQGKGKSYANDLSVNMQNLSSVGRKLVDIHGQHDQQGLLKKDTHLQFLDSFAGTLEEAESHRLLYAEAAGTRNELQTLKTQIRERSQRIEFLTFQINEIDAAGLKEGEREKIEEERSILLNAGKLKELSENAYSLLYGGDNDCSAQLAAALSCAKEISRIDSDTSEFRELLEAAAPLIKDASLLIRDIKDKYDIDPKKLDLLEERLDLLKKLEKKYGPGADAVLAFREKAAAELEGLTKIEDRLEALTGRLSDYEERLKSSARNLSEKRREAAKKIKTATVEELHQLGFPKAEFGVEMTEKSEVSDTGQDDVEFLFSANPGEPARPLSKVASGGELSRIMLALKCVEIQRMAGGKKRSGPAGSKTLIFDEVDSGIGGVTARHVGRRLREISKNYQVLCITHLPQIAAMASNHLKVEKSTGKDAVRVSVKRLDKDERKTEIARMLSGNITDSSLKHAAELLEG